jgi:hypothetical protein
MRPSKWHAQRLRWAWAATWFWWTASRCFAGRDSHLVNRRTGCFRPTLGFISGSMRLFTGRIRSVEIEAEAAAQIALLQARGLALTHIDTHKHTHMFPAVLRPVLRAAKAAGIRAVRNPFEPAGAIAPLPALRGCGAQVNVLRLLEPAFRRIVAEEGFATTDGAIGVLGHGNPRRRHAPCLAPRTARRELGTGHASRLQRQPIWPKGRTRLLASRDIEREALLTHQRIPGNRTGQLCPRLQAPRFPAIDL